MDFYDSRGKGALKKVRRGRFMVSGHVLNILTKTSFLKSLLLIVTYRAILVCSLPVTGQLVLQPRNNHAKIANNGSNNITNQQINNAQASDIRSTTGHITIGTAAEDSHGIQTASDDSQASHGTIVNTIKNDRGNQVTVGDAKTTHGTTEDVLGIKQGQVTLQAATMNGGRLGIVTNQKIHHKNQAIDNAHLVAVSGGAFQKVAIKGDVNDAECPTTLNTAANAWLNQRSECPWTYEFDRNPFRTPQVILQARPLCSRCIGHHGPDTRCETLKEQRTVFIRDGQGKLKTETILVSVASVCTAITLAPGQLLPHPM